MADRVATSDDAVADGAPAGEALRAVRKARLELLAVLAPLVIAAAVLVAGYGFLVSDALSFFSMPWHRGSLDLGFGSGLGAYILIIALMMASFILFPIISACFLGMRIIFKSIRGSNPMSMRLDYTWMVGMLVATVATLPFSSWFFLFTFAEGVGFLTVPGGIVGIVVGFRLMSVRSKRLEWLAGERPRPSTSRRRVLAEAALGIAALAAGAVAVASLSALSLSDPSLISPGALAFLAFALSLPLPFLFLPLALMSSDAYHHRRKRLGLGPDMRLGQVIAGMVAAAAVLAAAGVALLRVLY